MYEVYMSVNDAKRGITALADVDDGMICDEWNEQFGAYGELTLDSRGGNIGILSEAIIYEVIRKPIRAAGYIDPPKPKKKKTHTVYVRISSLEQQKNTSRQSWYQIEMKQALFSLGLFTLGSQVLHTLI